MEMVHWELFVLVGESESLEASEKKLKQEKKGAFLLIFDGCIVRDQIAFSITLYQNRNVYISCLFKNLSCVCTFFVTSKTVTTAAFFQCWSSQSTVWVSGWRATCRTSSPRPNFSSSLSSWSLASSCLHKVGRGLQRTEWQLASALIWVLLLSLCRKNRELVKRLWRCVNVIWSHWTCILQRILGLWRMVKRTILLFHSEI